MAKLFLADKVRNMRFRSIKGIVAGYGTAFVRLRSRLMTIAQSRERIQSLLPDVARCKKRKIREEHVGARAVARTKERANVVDSKGRRAIAIARITTRS